MPGALDGDTQVALMSGTGAGLATWTNLAAITNKTTQ
jgi:hypothetical protein